MTDQGDDWIPGPVHPLRVKPGTAVDLEKDYDPGAHFGVRSNDWERYLVSSGIWIVKIFLNVSKEEQRVRFLQRIDRPEKNWKSC